MLENISKQIGTFLPSILSAIAVLVVGWLIAHILSRLVRAALERSGYDTKIGNIISPAGNIDAGKIISKIVFYGLMLFVLITFFNVLNLPVVSDPLNQFLGEIFAYAPRVLSALGLGLVAYVLARLLKEVTQRALEAVNIDQRLAALGQDTGSDRVTKIDSTTDSLAPQPSAPTTDPPQPEIDLDEDSFSESAIEVESPIPANDEPNLDLGGLNFPEEKDFPKPERFRTEPNDPSTKPSSEPPTKNVSIATTGDSVKLSKSIPEAVYWLVFALFLPAILGALQIPGLLEPIQSMFTKAMNYLPNIIGAALILLIGLFVAKIVRQVISNLSASFGINSLAAKVGMADSLRSRKISDVLGVLAYALVLLPILVAALNTLDIEAVTEPASAVLTKITSLLPGFLGACIVLSIAFFVGKIVGGVVEDLLAGVGFNHAPEKIGLKLSNLSEERSPAKLVGKIVLVAIVLLSVLQALPMMGLDSLATHVDTFVGFATRLLLGLGIFAIGLYLAHVAAKLILDSGIANANQFAIVARIAIIVFAGGFALQQIGLSASIINVAFASLLGGIALATAIAFGWGGRDAAKRILDRYVK